MGRPEDTAASNSESTTLEGLVGSRRVEAWILCLPEHEKFPESAFLRVDWRLRGAVTRALGAGALSRSSGEVSLLPVTRMVSDQNLQTFKILTLGVRDRSGVTQSEISHLQKNIEGLKLKSVGISAKNFGWSKSEAKKHFQGMKGVEVCVTD